MPRRVHAAVRADCPLLIGHHCLHTLQLLYHAWLDCVTLFFIAQRGQHSSMDTCLHMLVMSDQA